MPAGRTNATRASFSSSATAPACLVAGMLLAGSVREVKALVPSTAATFGGLLPSLEVQQLQRRACVRPRVGGMRLSAIGGSGAEDMDSSELYADMRHRLKELHNPKNGLTEVDGEECVEEEEELTNRRRSHGGTNNGRGPDGGSGEDVDGVKAYSGQEMKKAYYEAFWRARNLHKEAKFEGSSQDDSNSAAPPPTSQLPSRSTMLTPLAMDLVLSRFATSVPASEVQGLTQMYYLEEEECVVAAPGAEAGAVAVAAAVGCGNKGGASQSKEVVAQAGLPSSSAKAPVLAFEAALPEVEIAAPQGLSQMFVLEPEEEAVVAAALPAVAGRSFLREKLGVPREVVQDLRQVELDHARLAMLAVLLTGAVGAGTGMPSGFVDAHVGFSSLAEVARTPWLDPCVAGVILALKALSEGDWRLGKGALAGWADRALGAVSDTGAKILRLGSGDEMRRLAVEMEVKHGRMALGAVVCAMAQQGLLTVGV